MDNLPEEILPIIFTQLPIIQKLECMLVCKRWRATISSSCLLNTVTIDEGNIELLSKFANRIEKTPILGAQVTTLTIPNNFNNAYDKASLLQLFPNLRVVKFDGKRNLHNTTRSMFNVKHTNKDALPSHIEWFEEYGTCHSINLLITKNLGIHLKTLKIILSSFQNDPTADEICYQLVNLPFLENLTISCEKVTLTSFEILHMSIPTLKSVSLAFFQDSQMKMPADIKPAVPVISLHLKFSTRVKHKLDELIYYIIKKYPNLKTFRLINGPYNIGEEEVAQYYKKSFSLIAQSYGHQLTTLTLLGTQIDKTVFDLLDVCGSRIKNLNLYQIRNPVLDALSTSSQCQSIETLQIDLLRHSTCNADWLTSLKVLRFIHIRYPDSSMQLNLNAFFQSCPETVRSISLSGASLNVETTTSTWAIEALTLDNMKMDPNIDTFISMSLPCLRCLAITCIHPLFSKPSLNFPNHSFSHLEISLFRYHVELKTLKDNKMRYYSIKSSNSRIGYRQLDCFVLPLSPEQDFNKNETLIVVCGSVKAFVFNNLKAYLS